MLRVFRKLSLVGAISIMALLPNYAFAQAETVEDVRRDIIVLKEQMQALRNELLATGNSDVPAESVGSLLQRMNTLETALGETLGRIELLQHKINEIADDGTRRIGDLEFRLTELEGGDTASLGTTVPLGGGTEKPTVTDTAVLVTDEKRKFEAAISEHEAGNYQTAAELFSAFVVAYPGGPLTSEAQYRRGQSLAAMNDWSGAARSYLDSFSGSPDGPLAAESLYELSVSLNELGQKDQACLTLNEISIRYPEKLDELGDQIIKQKQQMACN